MALLLVQASVVPGLVHASTTPPTVDLFNLWVSVSDLNGAAPGGHGTLRFDVEFIAGGAVPFAPQVVPLGGGQGGFYHLQCRRGLPATPAWELVDYVVTIGVENAADRGQALTRIFSRDMA